MGDKTSKRRLQIRIDFPCDNAAMTRNDGTPHICIKQQMALFVEFIK